MKGKKATIATLLVLWALLIAFSAVLLNRQSITDWMILRNYTPPPEIAAIAETTAMSEEGRRLFYVHDPSLLDSQTFQVRCEQREKSIVLGCYDGVGIYIFDVNEPRLAGVEEVTSAHEMLHAAYDRLSGDERREINALLDEVAAGISNPRLLALFASYRERNIDQFSNELHSIIGTEIASLPSELENYYARFFTDRQRVVALASEYERVFSELKDQVQRLDADLSLRKAEIDRREGELISEASELASQKAEMDRLLSANQIEAYNQLVPAYNNAVILYNQHLGEVRQLIAEYNQLVKDRNTIVVTQNDLINSLDARAPEVR